MIRTAFFLIALVALSNEIDAQTNLFPASGNVGIGTTSPSTSLHIKPNGTYPAWVALDKEPGMETGIRFLKSANVLFYLYSDNDADDALKVQSTGVSGEGDGAPRIEIPYSNKDLYLTTSGGNVSIGHRAPGYKLDVYAPEGSWKGRFQGPDGYILMGPANAGWAHIYTDRPAFIFNQAIWSSPGVFSAYGNANMSLCTDGTTRVTISKASGNVGIGTTTPGGLLEISGPYSGNSQLIINSTSSNAELRFSSNGIMKGFVWYEPSKDIMAFGRGNVSNSIIVNGAGNVGIGTSSPNEKLTVNGSIYSKEVRVDLSVPAPDYVFESNYDLPQLDELRSFIDEHKHLPDVPSGKEMEKDGIEVGEMNMLLLKKIEELTLYVIELKEENVRQNAIIQEMQK